MASGALEYSIFWLVRSLLLLLEVAKDSCEKTGFVCAPPGVVVTIKNIFSTVTGTRLPTNYIYILCDIIYIYIYTYVYFYAIIIAIIFHVVLSMIMFFSFPENYGPDHQVAAEDLQF